MWYLKTLPNSHLQLLVDCSSIFVVIEFHVLPTTVYYDISILKTDGEFKIIDVIERNSLDIYLQKKGFYSLPDGFRYGTYLNNNDQLNYKKEFWFYPRINYETCHQPQLVPLRQRQLINYSFQIN